MFVALGVVLVTVAFGVVTYFLKTQEKGRKKRPVALDPQKKIPFKLIDKKVSLHDFGGGATWGGGGGGGGQHDGVYQGERERGK